MNELRVSDFDYQLDQELIAQAPPSKRDGGRLMHISRKGEISHHFFPDIKDFLNPGDCLVLNDTKVIPARLFGVKQDTGKGIEFLLIKRLDMSRWEVILKPGKRAKQGAVFQFGSLLKAVVIQVLENGNRIVEFSYTGVFEEILDKLGHMPLPPYITQKLDDTSRYQTVYAKNDGSAAAPTAGLHFTPKLLEEVAQKGVDIAFVTLHVGISTFRPVKVENVREHTMHCESYGLNKQNAEKINRAKRVIACGTTTVRTLEAIYRKHGRIIEDVGDTDIFIYPGYEFKTIDGIITNFHLPKSTLLMLVAAFSGRETIMEAYGMAVEQRYRFFSFGDAMYIEKNEA